MKTSLERALEWAEKPCSVNLPRGFASVSPFGLITLGSILALALLLRLAPPDGSERSHLMLFIGRLHPLAVHLPIALLILVPVFEIAGSTRRFSYLLSACSFILGVSTIGSILAVVLGWCLARSGGYTGHLVTQHMWAALGTAIGTWLCWQLRLGSEKGRPSPGYVLALTASVVMMSFAGYRGGQLSLGETHLTEYMPERLASLLGVSSTVEPPPDSPYGGPNTFYGARVQPIFGKNCVTCHGRNKHKGSLRLDSFEAVVHGGEHGVVVKPGDIKGSEILRRISLSPSDHDFMPQERQPVSSEEVKLLEQWISAGASGTLPQDAIQQTGHIPVAEVSFEEIDPAAVTKQRSGMTQAVLQLQQQMPSVVEYRSRSSADVVVNAAWMQSRFGDSEVAALSTIADHIVSADFSGTAITDQSATALAKMKHLHILRLAHTRISDKGLRLLASLSELQSLSLFDTPATPAALQVLVKLPKLEHIYVGGTKISPEMRLNAETASKVTF